MPVPRFLLSEMFSNDVNDKEQQDFFAAVGRALSGWQFVEGAVHRLHEAAVLPAIPGALSASFHQIQTFNGKLQATDMAVRFTLLEKNQSEGLARWQCYFEKNGRSFGKD